MVLHEEHHPKCKSSKKNKAKKIPQRGLGVAQLEKLRIEEQQKNNTAAAASSSSSSLNSSHPLVISVPPQPQQRLPSLPFLSPRDHIPLVRSAISPSLPTIDFFKADPVGFSASNAEELKYLSSLWNEEGGFSNLNAAEAAMLGASKSQHHQYVSPIRLIGNKAAFIPISSGVNLQMEPPSNQNYSTNSSRREEERIAGTNLPWPFHPDTAMSFPYKVPSFNTPFLKPEESMSMYGKSPFKFDYKSPGFSKEGTSSSNSHQADWRNSEVHTNKRLRENVVSADSGFLTLGSSATHPTSRPKQPLAILPELSPLQSQGGTDDTMKQSANSSQKTFYSFLPMASTAQEIGAKEHGGEAADDVDTNLKL